MTGSPDRRDVPSTHRGNKQHGNRALRHVERERREADLRSSTRMTFVAPRLPEPCLRRSMPFDLPAMYAAGIEPSEYEASSASISVMSLLRRIRMRSGFPANGYVSRKRPANVAVRPDREQRREPPPAEGVLGEHTVCRQVVAEGQGQGLGPARPARRLPWQGPTGAGAGSTN